MIYPTFLQYRIVFSDRDEFNKASKDYWNVLTDIGYSDMSLIFDDEDTRDSIVLALYQNRYLSYTVED